MSRELGRLLKERAALRVMRLPTGLVVSLAVHVLLGGGLLLGGHLKANGDKEETTKVTWVTLPAAAGGASGGSGAQEVGETGERVRRVEEVAPETNTGGKGVPTPQAYSTATKQPGVKGTNKDSSSMGTARDSAKGKTATANPTPGTSGSGGGGGIGEGSGIPGLKASGGAQGGVGLIGDLDGNFPFVWYLQQVQNRITGNWSRMLGAQGRVQIYFRIQKDGRIENARIETPSGNGALDQGALLAVKRSDPLPPLPEGFDGKYLGIRFWFSYLGQ